MNGGAVNGHNHSQDPSNGISTLKIAGRKRNADEAAIEVEDIENSQAAKRSRTSNDHGEVANGDGGGGGAVVIDESTDGAILIED
jgi:hypothetical protein